MDWLERMNGAECFHLLLKYLYLNILDEGGKPETNSLQPLNNNFTSVKYY